MRTKRTLLISVVLTLSVLAALLAAPVASAQGDGHFVFLRTNLTGAEEVLGGDPDGTGFAFVRIDPTSGEICYLAVGAKIDPATAAHIHVGAVGEVGPPVLTLEQTSRTSFRGCATDPALADALLADPAAYYINIHNTAYPDGAIRGQLG